jgi:hypothetical protein
VDGKTPNAMGDGVGADEHPLDLPAAVLTPVAVDGTTAFGAAALELRSYGFTEREFYADGSARRYRNAVAGLLTDAEVIDDGHTYRTRVLVRWPTDPQRFNGTLIVEWNNVSTGQDVDFCWAESHHYLLREGCAFASLSVQTVGIERLKAWSPQRYGTLSVTGDNADPRGGAVDAPGPYLDPVTGQIVLDDPNGPVDPLAWDIMAQVSRALTGDGGRRQAMPGLQVEHVIAAGESQSGDRLATYYNTVHPLHRLFDGFVYYDGAWLLRPDLATPAVTVNTEFGGGVRGAAVESPNLRVWEVAGASHVSASAVAYVDGVVLRDRSILNASGTPLALTETIQECELMPPFSTVPTGFVLSAAFDAVRAWIHLGRPAPASCLLERREGQLSRDDEGRSVGGVRLPHVTVPTAFTTGHNSGPGFCVLAGHHRIYTREELRARYRGHEDYVARVTAASQAVAAQGYLLTEDARDIVRQAAASDVGS